MVDSKVRSKGNIVNNYDVIIIGGGIAGVSIGYELSSDRSVGLLEMEETLAYHATGRSAATFLESYGGEVIRVLTTSSRAFYENPPNIFEESPLTPLPLLWLGSEGEADLIRELHASVSLMVPGVRLLGPEETYEVNPILRPGSVELSMLELGASEIDVHAVHQGYCRGFRLRNGEIRTSSKVTKATYASGMWSLVTRDGEEYRAPVVINAAGAWVDEVASIAGVDPIGILSLRRSIFMIGAPEGLETSGLPFTGDISGTYYIKPEGRQFLCSPADETPQPPGDARPDELEIARALDAVNLVTTLDARHVRSSWSGLRSFTPDRVPIVGFDLKAEGFFWFAGQGGYGIQTAPSMARTGAAVVRGLDIPGDVRARGLESAALAPDRPGISIPAAH